MSYNICKTSQYEVVDAESTRTSLTPTGHSLTLKQGDFDSFVQYIDAKPRTVETYTRALKQFGKYLQEVAKTNAPTRKDILEYRRHLEDGGYKATTIQNYLMAVKLFFGWASSENVYPNVASHVKGARISHEHKKDYLTTNQINRVLSKIDRDALTGKRDYAMMVLMITGGLRTIEVSRANIEDLNIRAGDQVLYIQGKGRDEKAEYVKVMPEVEDAIRDYLMARGKVDKTAPLFVSESRNSKGKRLTTRSISGIVKTRLVNAGYDSERLTAHSLRHTAVTLSLMNGSTIQEAQQFARHASIETTNIYAHNLDRNKNKSEERIANAIFKH